MTARIPRRQDAHGRPARHVRFPSRCAAEGPALGRAAGNAAREQAVQPWLGGEGKLKPWETMGNHGKPGELAINFGNFCPNMITTDGTIMYKHDHGYLIIVMLVYPSLILKLCKPTPSHD